MMDKPMWLVLVAVLVGCGGVAEESPGESATGGSGGNTGGSGGAAATGGSGGTPGTDAGTTIWPGDAIRLHATNSGGGWVPQPPPGSNCTFGADYTLEVATRTLSWTECVSDETWEEPWVEVSGHGTLTEAQYATVEEAMLGLSVYEGDMCGADKPMLGVEVTTPEGTTAYHDNFYACLGGDYVYVENIDAVFVALGALTE